MKRHLTLVTTTVVRLVIVGVVVGIVRPVERLQWDAC